MITLALFNEMTRQKVAGLIGDEDDPKRNFYWEEAPLTNQKDLNSIARGVWLITRAGNINQTHRNLNLRTTVDFYVAMADKVKTEQILQQIRRWLTKTLYICQLSGDLDGDKYQFSNIRIRPTTTPANSGVTENGLIVKVASAELVYDDDLQYEVPTVGGVILTEVNKQLLTEVGRPIRTEAI